MKGISSLVALSLASFAVGMSGTPLKTRGDDIFPICDADKKYCWTPCGRPGGGIYKPIPGPGTPGDPWCWQSEDFSAPVDCETDDDCLDIDSSHCLFPGTYDDYQGILGGCSPSL